MVIVLCCRYGIHRNTLTFKLRESESTTPPRKTGGQTALSPEEEKVIVSHVIALASFGFPVTTFELRLLIKSHLTRLDRKVGRFKDNLPGKEWAIHFLKRHKKELSQRMSQNIARSRAALDKDSVNEYFDNLSAELEGIPPENIWNYDESNLQDDPGSKKIIVKRGCKHPEIIKNATKVSVSIMMCGNAVGTLAPVYVTYKADGLYQCWMEGGPPGTRYNRSKSGWFDSCIFEDWFEFLLLPMLKKQNGTKVLIGDNLSSHLNSRVLALCRDYDIKFIALPPHSTHLLQPLDVAFFRPMKGEWRSILTKWKETDEGRRVTTVPKTIFPRLLKDLMEALSERQLTNLKAGFKACGIHPLNRNEVVKKLCDSVFESSGDHIERVSESFLAELRSKRDDIGPKKAVRRKKVNVPPGKGITYDDIASAGQPDLEQPSTSVAPNKKQNKQNNSKSKVKHSKRREISSSSDEDMEIVYAESDESFGSLLNYNEKNTESSDDNVVHTCDMLPNDGTEGAMFVTAQATPNSHKNQKETPPPSGHMNLEFKQGDYVAVQYQGKIYPGKILSNFDQDGEACIAAMKKHKKHWMWPNPPDQIWYKREQVLRRIATPSLVSCNSNDEVYLVDLKP